jgi:hypothetical protein
MCVVTNTNCDGCKVSEVEVHLCERGCRSIVCVDNQLVDAKMSWTVVMDQVKRILSGLFLFPNRIEDTTGRVIWSITGNEETGVASVPVLKKGNNVSALIFGLLPTREECIAACSRCMVSPGSGTAAAPSVSQREKSHLISL